MSCLYPLVARLLLCRSMSSSAAGKGDWRWRSNFYKDQWNKDSFGKVRKKEDMAYPPPRGEVQNASFWTGIVDRAKFKRNAKKQSAASTPAADSLEVAIASASLELTQLPKTKVEVSSMAQERPSQPPLAEVLSMGGTTPFLPSSESPLSAEDLADEDTLRRVQEQLSSSVAADPLARHWPSVTKILSDTMPQEDRMRLQKWEEKMKRELGDEGFRQMRQGMLTRGTNLHAYIEATLMGDDAKAASASEKAHGDTVAAALLTSVDSVLPRFSFPLALEKRIAHPQLEYRGVADALAVYKKGALVLIDWKTSNKKKRDLKSTFDAPLQLAAYAGAVNADPNLPFTVQSGLIVVVHNSGEPAGVLTVARHQIEQAWHSWCQRLALFKKMREYDDNLSSNIPKAIK